MDTRRLLYLIFIAMLMFAGGVVIQFTARDPTDRALGVIAMLGAIAIILANINGKGR